MQNEKKKLKLFFLTGDMVLYVENPKDSTKKKQQLELISEFNKLARYIINTQRSIMFLQLPAPLKEDGGENRRRLLK